MPVSADPEKQDAFKKNRNEIHISHRQWMDLKGETDEKTNISHNFNSHNLLGA